jgi:hypothetical protein
MKTANCVRRGGKDAGAVISWIDFIVELESVAVSWGLRCGEILREARQVKSSSRAAAVRRRRLGWG